MSEVSRGPSTVGEMVMKSIVAIAVEIKQPEGLPGGSDLQSVPDVSQDSLIPLSSKRPSRPGATVDTDGRQVYWTVPEHGYMARADHHAQAELIPRTS